MAIAIYQDVQTGRHHWAEATSRTTHEKLDDGEWVLFDSTPDTPPPAADPFDAAMAARVPGSGLAAVALRAAFDGVFEPQVTSSFSRFALDKLTAKHAAAPLTLTTYDGSGQLVHPDVVIFEEPWNGYRYWMAATPYPNSNDVFENPSIWASTDGLTWVVPAGLTNPIHTPTSGFEPDPALFFEDGVLYCIYSTDKWQSSTTGSTWSARANVGGISGLAGRVSPTLVKHNDTYMLWHVHTTPAPNTVELRTSTTSPVAGYGSPTIATVTGLPAGREVWHIAIRPVVGGFVGAFVLCDLGTGGASAVLHLAFSEDGLNWNVGPVLLGPQGGTAWSGAVYRSCFIPTDGRGGVVGRLWYTGFDRAQVWRLGYTEVYAAAAEGLPDLAWSAKPNLDLSHQVIRGDSRNRVLNPSLLRPNGNIPEGWNNNLVGATGHGWDVAKRAWTFTLNSTTERSFTQGGFPVTPGQSYTLSAEAQTGTEGVGLVDVEILWQDAGGATLSFTRPAAPVGSVGGLKRLSTTGTAPVGAVTASALLLAKTATATADQFWFRRVQFEQADGPTPWTPNTPLAVVAPDAPLGPNIEVLAPLTTAGQPRLLALVESTDLAAGEAIMDRSAGLGDGSLLQTGVLALRYFTAKKTERISQVKMLTGAFAAAATPTLARIGVFSVAADGSLTLVAATANDTALFSAASTAYQKALGTAFTKLAGQRYAVGVLVVSGAAMPSLIGGVYPQVGTTDTLLAQAPRITGAVGSLSDMPSTVAAGSVVATRRHGYAELLP